MERDTATAQNIVAGLILGIYLNVDNPPSDIKRQYHKARIALENAKHELDMLNDLIEDRYKGE